MDLYADNILDHYRHPHRKGELPAADVERAERNVSCGDEVTVRLKLEDGRIADLAWTGNGCAISQAGMSMLADELIGKTPEEAEAWTAPRMLELLGVPVGQRRLKCALLAPLAARNAARLVMDRQPLGWMDIAAEASESPKERL
jgi:nitrogen fixation protein NifU and related proteins